MNTIVTISFAAFAPFIFMGSIVALVVIYFVFTFLLRVVRALEETANANSQTVKILNEIRDRLPNSANNETEKQPGAK